MWLKKSSSNYIMISFLALFLVLSSYLNYLDSKENAVKLIQKQNKSKIDGLVEETEDFFYEKQKDLEVLANFLSKEEDETEALLVNEFDERSEGYFDLLYIGLDGRLVYQMNNKNAYKKANYANEPMVAKEIKSADEAKISKVSNVFKIDDKNFGIAIITPITHDSSVKGFLVGIFDTKTIGKSLLYKKFRGTDDSFFGVRKEGERIFSLDEKYLGVNVKDTKNADSNTMENYKKMMQGIVFQGQQYWIPSNGGPKSGDRYIASKPIIIDGDIKFSIAITSLVKDLEFMNTFVIKELVMFFVIFLVTLYNLYNIYMSHVEKKEMQRQIEKTEAIDKQKTEFFCNMSHELRTPLTIILNALHFILKKNEVEIEKDEEFKKMFLKIRQNAYRLLKLVNNLLEISRFESGFVIKQFKNLDIVRIIEDITMSVVFYAQQKGVNVTFDTDVEEKIVAVDEDGIEKVIMNLLSNSLKFTPSGGNIFVNISEDENYVMVSVKDNGIGIPEDKKEIIFDRFTQVDSSLRRTAEGSGIGLSIVKSIVDLHEGKIDVISKENEGTEFIVYIPNKVIEGEEVSTTKKLDQEIVNNINIQFSDI